MPCSCGGMRRSGLAPTNIAIRQKQPTTNVQQFYTPPPQQRPTQPPQQSKPIPQTQTLPQPQTQTIPVQSNRPNFSGNLPSIRRK